MVWYNIVITQELKDGFSGKIFAKKPIELVLLGNSPDDPSTLKYHEVPARWRTSKKKESESAYTLVVLCNYKPACMFFPPYVHRLNPVKPIVAVFQHRMIPEAQWYPHDIPVSHVYLTLSHWYAIKSALTPHMRVCLKINVTPSIAGSSMFITICPR